MTAKPTAILNSSVIPSPSDEIWGRGLEREGGANHDFLPSPHSLPQARNRIVLIFVTPQYF